jgi:2-amino-4-hydroxy-6-hydroxymethyldihydropteridine diphosphokinase
VPESVATVHLALGSNRGDRAAHFRNALAGLRALLEVDAVSAIYETDPVGVLDQPVFWNMALRAHTTLAPDALLDAVKALEGRVGRTASVRMGPREIDIDLLLHGAVIRDSARLTLPHPGLMARPFVLRPVIDVSPDLRHPVTGDRLDARLRELGETGIRRVGTAADVLEREPAR